MGSDAATSQGPKASWQPQEARRGVYNTLLPELRREFSLHNSVRITLHRFMPAGL